MDVWPRDSKVRPGLQVYIYGCELLMYMQTIATAMVFEVIRGSECGSGLSSFFEVPDVFEKLIDTILLRLKYFHSSLRNL